jgi:hypothetical protein
LWSSRRQFYGKHFRPMKVWLAAQIVRLGMRRKASQDIEAAGRGELMQETLAERLQCYEKVVNIWLQPEAQHQEQGQEKYA